MPIIQALLLIFPITFFADQRPILKFPKYPYGLLTEDYGVITENDLKLNAERQTEVSYSFRSPAYEYWQCFPVKEISFFCEYFEVDDPQNTFADTHIRVNLGDHFHEYITRRPWDQSVCHNTIKEFQKLTKNSKAACISGSSPGGDNGNVYWTFGRFKTKSGCTSYFEEECSKE